MNSMSKQSAWFYIGETLVEESKQHISAEQAVDKIRTIMRNTPKPHENRFFVDIDDDMSEIEILSELRSRYSCFDEHEEPVYHALSEAIKALSAQQWLPLSASDIDNMFKYYAESKDEDLTDKAQELKECMWIGYKKAKAEEQRSRKNE